MEFKNFIKNLKDNHTNIICHQKDLIDIIQ